jgi:uncharacterized protein
VGGHEPAGALLVVAEPFPAAGQLTPAVLAANAPTIQNLRWWDPAPLLDTYRQLQELRLYYDFHDVDVDRYRLDGSYQQVLLAARELNQARSPRTRRRGSTSTSSSRTGSVSS